MLIHIMQTTVIAKTISCPYCGEPDELSIDLSGGDQDYVEDCQVCCRPIECRIRIWGDEVAVEVMRDDE